jgi:hypothetical protein
MLKLKRTCSVLALLVALGMAPGDVYAQGPETSATPSRMSLTIEGAPFFVRNDPNLLFSATDDKLGNLGGVGTKGLGGYGRVALTNKLNPTWDLRVSASALATAREEKNSPYKISERVSKADQAFRMAFADVEVGAQAISAAGIDLRLSAGIRAFRSETNGYWSTETEDKIGRQFGNIDDKAWGAGPRVGAELTVPLSKHFNLVTGASLAALYHRDVDNFLYKGSTLTKNSSSSWSINADALGAISLNLDGGAKLSAGYKAQYWDNMLAKRTEMKNGGSFQQKGRSPLIAHGPLVSLTFPIGGK